MYICSIRREHGMRMCLHIIYLLTQSSDVAVVKWPLVWTVKYEAKHEKSAKCWTLTGFGSNVCFPTGFSWLWIRLCKCSKWRLIFFKEKCKNQPMQSWFSDSVLLDRQLTVWLMLEKSCLLTFLINKMGIIPATFPAAL